MSQVNILLQHHAHVWVSDPITLEQEIIGQLQQLFCKHHGCKLCTVCTQIAQQQHPCINWFNPEGSYTLDEIDQIIDNVKFKLDRNERRFFILNQAQELTPACSNRLLKTIEEPHPGYYFIFLASRTDTILPTILSRSFFKEFPHQHVNNSYQEIMQPFMSQTFQQPTHFIRLIDKMDINHQVSKNIIDNLISYFYQELKKLHQEPKHNIQAMNRYMNFLVILQNQLATLPLQGSSKLFWKNLYITFHSHCA
jgi:hypothetical protein